MVQGTHVQVVPAVVASAVSRLLDLEGLAVREIVPDGFGGRVVHVVTADLSASACPSCGEFSTALKGHVTTRPRDVPYGTRPLRLVWHKRRWRCVDPLLAARLDEDVGVTVVRICRRGEGPVPGFGAGPSCVWWRFDVRRVARVGARGGYSAVTSATAARVADSSTMVLFVA